MVEEEIKVEIAETLPEPIPKQRYTIEKAEIIQTSVRGYKGVRVTLKDEKGNHYATMLWLRDRVGTSSKLGAFITALGTKVSQWKGKQIEILEWTERRRAVKLVGQPLP